MLELISIHIPKCGGSAIRQVLRQKYDRRLRDDYDAPHYPIRAYLRAKARRAYRKLGPNPRCVHGHFCASKYAETGARMIVFVRDPAERHVSMWRYIRRNNEMSGYIYNQEWRLALSFDLADFMALPNPVGLHRYLDVPLHRFSFVGAMSDFDADVERLCAWLSIDYEPVRANTAPTPTVVSTEMRDAYERANSEEMDLYYAALQRREVLCRDMQG